MCELEQHIQNLVRLDTTGESGDRARQEVPGAHLHWLSHLELDKVAIEVQFRSISVGAAPAKTLEIF